MPTLKRTLRSLLPPLATLLACSTLALAAPLTGVVTDRTTGKPSAGDTIAVINTAQGMDEIARATSGASGHFTVNVPDGGQILLHITHGGAEYFKSVPPNATSVDIDVYDSAAKIDGITGEATVLRAETGPGGATLDVAENFFVQNASDPPRTQYGGNTFDFYLPKGAAISQSLANAPGGLPTNVKLVTLDAAAGHYAFTFPVRPGETRFQVAYTLPYSGSQRFALELTVPTGDVAIMLPKSMQFQPVSDFQPINPDPNAQSFDAHNPSAAQPVEFTLSGTGQLPQNQDSATGGSGADQSAGSAAQPASASDTRPGGGLGRPVDPEGENDPWAKYRWWVLGLLGLALAAGAGVMLKTGPPGQPGQPGPTAAQAVAASAADPAAPGAAPAGRAFPAPNPAVFATLVSVGSSAQSPLLQALKDELFELETDRLAGRLSEAEYAEHKAALDLVLRRAFKRIQPAAAASNG